MIAHISIPAHDPRAAAEVFGRIIDGEVMPFPVVEGAWVAIARDGSGLGVEVLAPVRHGLSPEELIPNNSLVASKAPARKVRGFFVL